RQVGDRQPAQEQNDDRDDDRQRRSLEELGKHGSGRIRLVSVPLVPPGGCYSAWYFRSASASSGLRFSYSTFSPSRICRMPSSTILWSSSTPPFLMTNRSSNSFSMVI